MSSLATRYSAPDQDVIEQLNVGFMKVLQNINQYNSKHSLSTWIRNVLVHFLIDEYRKGKKENETYSRDLSDNSVQTSLNSGSEKLDADYLFKLLTQLPPTTRQVFSLFAIDGFKHQEIAKMFNISVGTSKWHVSEARNLLKSMLEEMKKQEDQILSKSAKCKV
jgi:RNA polymerase sigma-70 factor (ECF subfamily)